MSNETFPFRTAKEISIGFARLLCVRITYVGELGYELHIPSEFANHVYERVVNDGEEFGVVHAGLKALNSLRLEKGYKDYGHDIDNTDNLLDVGLSFTVDLKKKSGFIGKEKYLEQKQLQKENNGLKKRLVHVLLNDPEPLIYHAEVIWRNGIRVGDVRAASYGHTLKGAVGLGMIEIKNSVENVNNNSNSNYNNNNSSGSNEVIDKKYIEEGLWEVEIANKKYTAKVSLNSFYDPSNEKIKL
jgi:4-methylaminobutanoate oxidase (formaldehyde-forming)